MGAEGGEAEVAGQHADVVVEPAHALDEAVQVRAAHVQVQVAQVQKREGVEPARQAREPHLVATQPDLQRVAAAAAAQSRERQRGQRHPAQRLPVLEVREVSASADHLQLVLAFQREAVPQVRAPDATLQRGELRALIVGAFGQAHRVDNAACIILPAAVGFRPWSRARVMHRTILNPPNLITLLRFVLVPVTAVQIVEGRDAVAFCLLLSRSACS